MKPMKTIKQTRLSNTFEVQTDYFGAGEKIILDISRYLELKFIKLVFHR